MNAQSSACSLHRGGEACLLGSSDTATGPHWGETTDRGPQLAVNAASCMQRASAQGPERHLRDRNKSQGSLGWRRDMARTQSCASQQGPRRRAGQAASRQTPGAHASLRTAHVQRTGLNTPRVRAPTARKQLQDSGDWG